MSIKLSGDLCRLAFLNNVPVARCVARINHLPDKRILIGDDQMMEGLGSHLRFLLLFFFFNFAHITLKGGDFHNH